ncbi:hypothetical protein A9F13_05g03608 [Clavispora lusitaniae]|uniref:Uncharacterized protein n=1 Tax=Clavispora lusitaniae TaxID=36911 RepID=A0AA91Q1U7_CLALS|nr:hypothetical protein A9F13_05g03608 [Clavispora lusitaniae]
MSVSHYLSPSLQQSSESVREASSHNTKAPISSGTGSVSTASLSTDQFQSVADNSEVGIPTTKATGVAFPTTQSGNSGTVSTLTFKTSAVEISQNSEFTSAPTVSFTAGGSLKKASIFAAMLSIITSFLL